MDPGQIDIGNVGASGTGIAHEKASIMQAHFRIAKAQDYLGQSKDKDYLNKVFSLPSFTPRNADFSSRTSGMYSPLSQSSTGTSVYFASNSSLGYDTGRSSGAGYQTKDFLGYSLPGMR